MLDNMTHKKTVFLLAARCPAPSIRVPKPSDSPERINSVTIGYADGNPASAYRLKEGQYVKNINNSNIPNLKLLAKFERGIVHQANERFRSATVGQRSSCFHFRLGTTQ